MANAHITPEMVEWARTVESHIPLEHCCVGVDTTTGHVGLTPMTMISLKPITEFREAVDRLQRHELSLPNGTKNILAHVEHLQTSNSVINGPAYAPANLPHVTMASVMSGTVPPSTTSVVPIDLRLVSSDQSYNHESSTRVTVRHARLGQHGGKGPTKRIPCPTQQLMTFVNPRGPPSHKTRAGGGNNMDACAGVLRPILKSTPNTMYARRPIKVVNTVSTAPVNNIYINLLFLFVDVIIVFM